VISSQKREPHGGLTRDPEFSRVRGGSSRNTGLQPGGARDLEKSKGFGVGPRFSREGGYLLYCEEIGKIPLVKKNLKNLKISEVGVR